MGHRLTIEVSDAAFAVLRRDAQAAGIPPERLTAETIERQFVTPGHEPAPPRAARVPFQDHFGEVDLGASTGSDNEGIDADLDREYADAHEGS